MQKKKKVYKNKNGNFYLRSEEKFKCWRNSKCFLKLKNMDNPNDIIVLTEEELNNNFILDMEF